MHVCPICIMRDRCIDSSTGDSGCDISVRPSCVRTFCRVVFDCSASVCPSVRLLRRDDLDFDPGDSATTL